MDSTSKCIELVYCHVLSVQKTAKDYYMWVKHYRALCSALLPLCRINCILQSIVVYLNVTQICVNKYFFILKFVFVYPVLSGKVNIMCSWIKKCSHFYNGNVWLVYVESLFILPNVESGTYGLLVCSYDLSEQSRRRERNGSLLWLASWE